MEHLDAILTMMLAELRSSHLEVVVVNELRAVVQENCEWYRRLCANHLKPRRRYPRLRTVIRRQATIKALQRMLRGDLRGVYASRILDVIEEMNYSELFQHGNVGHEAWVEFEIPP